MARNVLTLWGATGFTGRLVAHYLAAGPARDLDWAIGGRDRSRLEALRDELGLDVEIVVADSHDRESLAAFVRESRVVISTVGPFARHGTPLVESCVEHGADYCDITGEVHWIRDNVDRLHHRAVDSGARIVHCCGFDSIPSDLGVWRLHDHMARNHGRALARARMSVLKARGGFSGGTVTSMLDLLEQVGRDRELRRRLGHPYTLNPDGERRGPDRSDQRNARYDAQLGKWTAPFVMAGVNTRIVRRSNALLDYPYGREFRYSENVVTRSQLQARLLALGLGGIVLGGLFAPTRWCLRRMLPGPRHGPSPAAQEAGFFKIAIRGTSDGAAPVEARCIVEADRDPGYGATSRMLAQAALGLAELPRSSGGILTPASCFGNTLFERLARAGIRFTVSDSAPGTEKSADARSGQ